LALDAGAYVFSANLDTEGADVPAMLQCQLVWQTSNSYPVTVDVGVLGHVALPLSGAGTVDASTVHVDCASSQSMNLTAITLTALKVGTATELW
jgi:hypothetical protein